MSESAMLQMLAELCEMMMIVAGVGTSDDGIRSGTGFEGRNTVDR